METVETFGFFSLVYIPALYTKFDVNAVQCHFKLPLSKFSLSNHMSPATPVSLTYDLACELAHFWVTRANDLRAKRSSRGFGEPATRRFFFLSRREEREEKRKSVLFVVFHLYLNLQQ